MIMYYVFCLLVVHTIQLEFIVCCPIPAHTHTHTHTHAHTTHTHTHTYIYIHTSTRVVVEDRRRWKKRQRLSGKTF